MKNPRLDELLAQAENPNDERRDLAIFNLYLAACKAQDYLDRYIEVDAQRNVRAYAAITKLGQLIAATNGRKTVPLQAVVDIWRDACHG